MPDDDVPERDKRDCDQNGDEDGTGSDQPEKVLVEVIFKGNRRAVYRNSRGVEVEGGMHVIVEADKGEDLGRIGMISPLLAERCRGKLLNVLRPAKDHEIQKREKLGEKEEGAFKDFRQRVERRQMPMKPVDVEYQFDGKKIRFYFTADHRVDFRELVRELASVYRTRIELRQIGVRDEAKRIGGLGPCGRELCCSTFIGEFAPISSQMARDQNLSLNPSKLSGLCGRLKCCLSFEHEFYRHAQSAFPRLGTRVRVEGAEGYVSSIDFFKENVTIKTEEGEEITLSAGDARQLPAAERRS